LIRTPGPVHPFRVGGLTTPFTIFQSPAHLQPGVNRPILWLSPLVRWRANMKRTLLKILTYPLPLRVELMRRVFGRLPLFSYQERLVIGSIDRPYYGYCIFQAAKLARSLGYPRISVIEFGCGGGNGLLNAEMHISEVIKIFGVDIELYGFDMGSGMPHPQDYRDMPHYFKGGIFEMDRPSMERKLKRAKLVIGNVKDTVVTFFEKYNPAPIGCALWDLDYYSSTRDALTLFDADPSQVLPRVLMYFDDIIGNDVWLCNEFTGERLAIEEFNSKHKFRKISREHSVEMRYAHQSYWPKQVYILHDFEHPRYNEFVAADELRQHQNYIRLR
jgi:hypothetical protein